MNAPSILSSRRDLAGLRRVALVVGNTEYGAGHKRLEVAAKDARQVAAKLQELGFELAKGEPVVTADRDRMLDAFQGMLGDDAVGLVFFSGDAGWHPRHLRQQ